MDFIRGVSRDQALLLPERLDDYIDEENPVRFIDVFVDDQDMKALGFQRIEPAWTGRRPYDPRDLLKLYWSERPRRHHILSADALTAHFRLFWGHLQRLSKSFPHHDR